MPWVEGVGERRGRFAWVGGVGWGWIVVEGGRGTQQRQGRREGGDGGERNMERFWVLR